MTTHFRKVLPTINNKRLSPGKMRMLVASNIFCRHMFPSFAICFCRKGKAYFSAGNNVSGVANGKHRGNMCPQKMFLATCFLILPGISVVEVELKVIKSVVVVKVKMVVVVIFNFKPRARRGGGDLNIQTASCPASIGVCLRRMHHVNNAENVCLTVTNMTFN